MITAFLMRPAIKWLVIGAIGLGAAFYVLTLKLTISHQDTVIARQEGQLKIAAERIETANRAVAEAKRVNAGNLAELDAIRGDHKNSVAALSAEIERIRAEKQKVQIVKKVIRENANACVGDVPPSIRSGLEWLRDSRPAGSSDGRNQN